MHQQFMQIPEFKMLDRKAILQALESSRGAVRDAGDNEQLARHDCAIAAVRAQLGEPSPDAMEISSEDLANAVPLEATTLDPDELGQPRKVCMTQAQLREFAATLNRQLLASLRFYQRRCNLLQRWQSPMRDPERTIVCDILANGDILPDSRGLRYGQGARDAGSAAEVRRHAPHEHPAVRLVWKMRAALRDDSGPGSSQAAFQAAAAAEDDLISMIRLLLHAAEEAQRDAERLEFLTRHVRGDALRAIGVVWPAWDMERAREAIDRARQEHQHG